MYWGLGLANLGAILSAVTALLVIYLLSHS
jgi:hypothetical protein